MSFKKTHSLRPIVRIPAFELAVLHVLWDKGESSVRQVRDQLHGEPAYTTVQTILNIMTRKRRTTRILSGRAYLYRAKMSREEVQKIELLSLLEGVFRGSVEDLVKMLSGCHDCSKRASRS